MTCESTQPTLNTTVQCGTFVLEFIQLCEKVSGVLREYGVDGFPMLAVR